MPPRTNAPSRHCGWRPADGAQLDLFREAPGARVGGSGPGQSGISCPAGQWYLPTGVSLYCSERIIAGRVPTCSDDMRARHLSSSLAAYPMFGGWRALSDGQAKCGAAGRSGSHRDSASPFGVALAVQTKSARSRLSSSGRITGVACVRRASVEEEAAEARAAVRSGSADV